MEVASPPALFSYADDFMLILIVAGGIAPAGATKGLSARPLETFGAHPCILVYSESCYSSYTIRPLNKNNQHKNPRNRGVRCERVEGAIAKPPPRLRRGEIPCAPNALFAKQNFFSSTTKRAKQSPVSPILSCETADYLTSSISREQATKIAAAILVPSASFASALLTLCLSK